MWEPFKRSVRTSQASSNSHKVKQVLVASCTFPRHPRSDTSCWTLCVECSARRPLGGVNSVENAFERFKPAMLDLLPLFDTCDRRFVTEDRA